MDSNIGFEMSLIVVEAIRGRCASFMSLPATVSEIFGRQTTPSILVVLYRYRIKWFHFECVKISMAPNSKKWYCLDCRKLPQCKRGKKYIPI